jgi:hypothetical protein
MQREVFILANQRIKDQPGDALRIRVGSNARIQVRGTGFNYHDQRVGIRMAGTGNQQRES